MAVQCGERVLLPEVRKLADEDLIITDGFSCQEMIAQSTDRQALHLAQVLQLGRHRGQHKPASRPEQAVIEQRRQAHRIANLRTAALLAGGVVLGVALWTMRRQLLPDKTQ